VKDIKLRPVEIGVLLFMAALCIYSSFYGSRLMLYNLTIIALYATVVTSLNLLLGLAGQASFAQTTFMAIGGYGLAILTTRFGVNPWAAIAIALVLSVGLALLIGKPLLRLRGHYLSMGTVALALGTASFANASSFTNGGWGISGVPALRIGDFSFRNAVAFLWLAWTVCAASLLVYQLLGNSHIGRAWRALSTRQDISATLGIDVPRYKLLALVIAASMASVAGSLYVAFTRFVGPDLYDISVVINLMFMLFVGGLRSTVGPIVGAAFVILVPQGVAGFEHYQNLVFFVLLLLVILVRPAGFFGRVRGGRPLEIPLPAWLGRRRGGVEWKVRP
jgi:branched-chain amino acid transport system permease protein